MARGFYPAWGLCRLDFGQKDHRKQHAFIMRYMRNSFLVLSRMDENENRTQIYT